MFAPGGRVRADCVPREQPARLEGVLPTGRDALRRGAGSRSRLHPVVRLRLQAAAARSVDAVLHIAEGLPFDIDSLVFL